MLQIAPSPRQPADAPHVPVDEEVRRLLSGQEAANEFRLAVTQMDEASARLGQRQDAGLETQRVQESILRKLEMIIESARSQQSGGSSGSSQGGQPQAQQQDRGSEGNLPRQASGQADSAGRDDNRGGTSNPGQPPGSLPGSLPGSPPGARGEEAGRVLDEHRREWGNLPPRVRDELLQGLNERFSPVYQELTEAYYRRLAEEGDR